MVEVMVVEIQVKEVVTLHHQVEVEVEWVAWVELQILKLWIYIQEEVVATTMEHLVEVVW